MEERALERVTVVEELKVILVSEMVQEWEALVYKELLVEARALEKVTVAEGLKVILVAEMVQEMAACAKEARKVEPKVAVKQAMFFVQVF